MWATYVGIGYGDEEDNLEYGIRYKVLEETKTHYVVEDNCKMEVPIWKYKFNIEE